MGEEMEICQNERPLTESTPAAPIKSIEEKPVRETEINKSTDENEKTEKKSDPIGCYCGKDRNLNIIELLCANCSKWFHEPCIGYQLGKLVSFLANYIFLCKNCSPNGLESFKKSQAQISHMCVTALANLQQTSVKEGTNRTMFNKDKEIIPYIEFHWEALTTTSRRVTNSWHITVTKALIKDIHILFVFEDSPDGQMYGLSDSDLSHIKPNYEAMIKGGTLKVTDMGIQHVSDCSEFEMVPPPTPREARPKRDAAIMCRLRLGMYLRTYRPRKPRYPEKKKPVPAVGVKSRSTKRKFPNDIGPQSKKGRGGVDLNTQKLPSHGYPMDHPYNKDGYRYLLAEPDPHAPFRQEFDESADWAGKPIPGWLYRTSVSSSVLLALHDRGPQLRVSEDRLSVIGDKGYATIRATHYVTKGSWYWEVLIEEMPEGSATRIGWGQDYANLQAPLGYDKFGYSWRSKKGTLFHESMGKRFTNGYAEGDVLGFMIVLPQNNTTKLVPNTYKDRPLVKFKSHLYYEDKDNVPERLKSLKALPGSKILFFKNGELQGEGFENIYQGSYYPMLSLHKASNVTVNFGPTFKIPPMTDYKYKPMSEKGEEAVNEQTLADVMYLTENEGKLRLDSFVL